MLFNYPNKTINLQIALSSQEKRMIYRTYVKSIPSSVAKQMRRFLVLGSAAATFISSLLGLSVIALPLTATAAQTYYVDCSQSGVGNGTFATPWKALSSANSISLLTGDQVRLKRGTTCTGYLTLTASSVTIAAYGTATAKPVIAYDGTSPYGAAIWVKGNSNTIENLVLRLSTTFASGLASVTCNGQAQRVNDALSGLVLEDSSGQPGTFGSYNKLRFLDISGFTNGIFVNRGRGNSILRNVIYNNNVMGNLDMAPGNDYGAQGIGLEGDDNEIAYNAISGHDACSFDYTRDGSGIEVYFGSNNSIHHNKGFNNNAFAELGGNTSANNKFTYNVIASSLTASHFLVTRGNTNFGPVSNTVVFNNTVYLTGASSNGIACDTCAPSILTAKNNILWVNGTISHITGQPAASANNLFYKTGGSPTIAVGTLPLTAITSSDPRFRLPSANIASADFHLRNTSPAVNAGSPDSVAAGYVLDFDQFAVPLGGIVDIGAHEQVLQNGSFEQTGGAGNNLFTPPWTFNVYVGASGFPLQDTVSGGTCSGALGNKSGRIKVTLANTANSHFVQLAQGNFNLYKDSNYKVTFCAKAATARIVDVVIQGNAPPYILHKSQAIPLITSWQPFAVELAISSSSTPTGLPEIFATDVFLGFNVAQSTSEVFVDDALIYRTK
jgi:hypothetical protein